MDKQIRSQSPIFSKTTDFIVWLFQHTEKYPKSERFRLARRLEDAVFNFYDLLIQAVYQKEDRIDLLRKADLELEKLRLYMRLAFVRKLTNQAQYHFAACSMVEIGKLLGGWLNSLREQEQASSG
jgi:hypothetical protein